MLKYLSVVLMFAVSLVMVGRLSAQETQNRGPRAPGAGVEQLGRALDKLNLTEDQKTQFAALRKDYGPKMKAAFEKLNLTDEQKQARQAAVKAAHEAGKNRQEAMEAGVAAMNLTADQKTARATMETLGKEFHEKVLALLTPEQKEQLKKMMAERGGRRARPQKQD